MPSRLFTSGLDFTCVGKSEYDSSDYLCYPKSLDARVAFNKMQRMLNALAPRTGLPVVKEDGILGAETVSSALRTLDWVRENASIAADPLLRAFDFRGPTDVAIFAQALAQTFTDAAASKLTPMDIEAFMRSGQSQKVSDIRTSNIIRMSSPAATSTGAKRSIAAAAVGAATIVLSLGILGAAVVLRRRRASRQLGGRHQDEEGRRDALIIVSAHKGDVRSASKIVRQAIRETLGPKFTGDPYHASYMTARVARGYQMDPRWNLHVSDDEMQKIWERIVELSKAAGWDRPPVDTYHD